MLRPGRPRTSAGMPLQNRVTPFGEVVALSGRGTMMGNRGILHDEKRRVVRPWQVRRWIACVLAFRGRKRSVMRPHSYTELFFLDEAVAFAAGHRPCAECRNADYRRFLQHWTQAHGGRPSADEVDARIHRDRLVDRRTKRTYRERLGLLPRGAYVIHAGVPWLLWDGRLLRWSDAGYTGSLDADHESIVDVLTPRSLVAVLAAGYVPQVHPSAARLP
jgi:hypothetical protein